MGLSDDLTRRLAQRAGVSASWSDMQGHVTEVSIEGLRALTQALGHPCDNDAQTLNSLAALDAGVGPTAAQARFLTASVGQPVPMPFGAVKNGRLEVEYEDGETRVVALAQDRALPAFDRPGYHIAHAPDGDFTVATAPARCPTFRDLSGGRSGWGLAAQIYSLGAGVECGVGDFGGVAELARVSGARGADFLAVSPYHATLGVPERFDSPYTPSSRQFFDPVYADLKLTPFAAPEGGARELVDWQTARSTKATQLKAAYDALTRSDAALRDEFERFRDAASAALRSFALFEAIRAAQAPQWDWRRWPAKYRSPDAEGAKTFAREHGDEIAFQIFLQWATQRSVAAAQEACEDAGMRVGLIADIATGLDPAGADAWARPDALLQGITIGAPPDPYTPPGQDWRLTTFSPHGLAATGYRPFIDMYRACLAQVGGLRLDHAMGMQRLYLIPEGLGPKQGTYVRFPSEPLFRLVMLEAWRRQAIVIGEDLGTYPPGFREYLAEQGVAGMRLLRIQRDGETGPWLAPSEWTPGAAALTVTHDIMSTAGWWKGAEIDPGARDKLDERAREREMIWTAFREAGAAQGETPPPEATAKVVDAAIAFVAKTPCEIKLVALEDLAGAEIQPNVPGTTNETPNWRHRFAETAEALLSKPEVEARLAALNWRDRDDGAA